MVSPSLSLSMLNQVSQNPLCKRDNSSVEPGEKFPVEDVFRTEAPL